MLTYEFTYAYNTVYFKYTQAECDEATRMRTYNKF